MLKSPLANRRITPIQVLLILNLVVGLLILGDYGDSWDEFKFYKYASLTLDSLEWFSGEELPTFGNTYDNYGPVYVAGITVVTRLVEKAGLGWAVSHVRHFIYFLTFQVGIYAFYGLSRRWMEEWAAYGATLLFSTQPLFWGHAFISPKDIPVMSFFLLSLFLGFRMVDHLFGKTAKDSGSFENFAIGWAGLPKSIQRNLWMTAGLTLLVLSLLIFGTQAVYNLIADTFHGIYDAQGQNLLGRIFEAIAEDAFSAEAEIYIAKAILFFQQARFFVILISPLPILAYSSKILKQAFWQMISPLMLAGIVLGLATSIRILAPLAALIVAIQSIRLAGKKSMLILAVYGFVAGYTLYFTWPYLWPDPISHLIESVRVMSQYPWEGRVLFNGQYYPPTALPRTYLPVVLAAQFTEPVWALAISGVFASLWLWKKEPKAVDVLWISAVWLGLPVIGLIAAGAPLYDNSRQVFFLLPPIFLIAGVGLDWLGRKFSKPLIKSLIIVGVVLPGIIQGIRLHPYQYIYYNGLVGGVEGASRRFELDYWGLSYLEAAEYLNAVAPSNARVWAAGPSHLLPIREDMSIYSLDQEFRADFYDYVVATTRYDLDITTFPEAEVIHKISREGALLTVIKGSTRP